MIKSKRSTRDPSKLSKMIATSTDRNSATFILLFFIWRYINAPSPNGYPSIYVNNCYIRMEIKDKTIWIVYSDAYQSGMHNTF